MQRQSEPRAGNHQRHTHTRNASLPTQANHTVRGARKQPPNWALHMQLAKIPHTHQTTPPATRAASAEQHGTHRGRNRYHPSTHTTKDEAPGQLHCSNQVEGKSMAKQTRKVLFCMAAAPLDLAEILVFCSFRDYRLPQHSDACRDARSFQVCPPVYHAPQKLQVTVWLRPCCSPVAGGGDSSHWACFPNESICPRPPFG